MTAFPKHLSKPDAYRTFTAPNLLQISMPMGGIGGGSICLAGQGGLQDFAIRNHPAVSALPDGHSENDAAFALLRIHGVAPVTKLIEGRLPPEKIFDQSLQSQGYRHGGFEGLPRFERCTFQAAFPFGVVSLEDPAVPLRVNITGWNPFIPLDDVASSIPGAIMEYEFKNPTDAPVEFDFSFHLSHLVADTVDSQGRNGRAQSRNRILCNAGSDEKGQGVLFSVDLPQNDERYGSVTLAAIGWQPRIKAMWLRGGWFDGISALWREISTGEFVENDGILPADDPNSRNGGSILSSYVLQPGERVTLPVLISWHFPNSFLSVGSAPACGCVGSRLESCQAPPAWRPFYVSQWRDAKEVCAYVSDNFDSLRSRTLMFQKALISSSVPNEVLDAVCSNLAILKSPTVLRQENGNIWAWEGCFPQSGCCHGSCTHVWNYAQAMPHLFPALERTLREQEYERSMDEKGHVNFRSALPDGPAPHDFHAAADGQLGGIMKLFRDWRIFGDRGWLERLYPLAKRSLEYCISIWDPDERGGLFEPHHNTYDIEFWGPDGMCGSVYVGALSAMTAMAEYLGHTKDHNRYQKLAHTAARFMDDHLFNGEYYRQTVLWEGLRNTSFAESLSQEGENASELFHLLQKEGPRYQYGEGCLSDGVIGAWMARIYDLETPLSKENVRSSLQAIFRHNFKSDLSSHACTQRPGYAMGHEPGLLLCTWPRGGKPTLPFVYSDEVWTGIEYQVASHLIEEGFTKEGLTIVKSLRSRYDGRVRNPFNEYECGSYYARAMASYALMGALSGFRYSAVDKTLRIKPKIVATPFRAFFSTSSGYGVIQLDQKNLTIRMIEGEIWIERLLAEYRGLSVDLSPKRMAQAGKDCEIIL